jgi:hypothetical protein
MEKEGVAIKWIERETDVDTLIEELKSKLHI